MDDYAMETWEYRDRWIKQRRKERGWSENEIKRGDRYRRWEEYVVVGVIWSLLILPAPLGFLLIVYGGYLRFRYRDRGERYVSERRELSREFHQGGYTSHWRNDSLRNGSKQIKRTRSRSRIGRNSAQFERGPELSRSASTVRSYHLNRRFSPIAG